MSIEVPSVTRLINQDRIDAYADASGDHNPIHVDPAFAATTPFGGTIAHGMLALALIGEMMQSAFGPAWTASGALKVRFKAPTRPGDSLTASASFAKQTDERHEFTIQCATQAGEVVIEGRASVQAAS